MVRPELGPVSRSENQVSVIADRPEHGWCGWSSLIAVTHGASLARPRGAYRSVMTA